MINGGEAVKLTDEHARLAEHVARCAGLEVRVERGDELTWCEMSKERLWRRWMR